MNLEWERPEWQQDAACKGMDPALFFPERGESSAEAKRVCRTCPVFVECEEFARGEKHGIWAATSERERRKVRASFNLPGRALGPRPTSVGRGHEVRRGSVPLSILTRMNQEGSG